MYLTIQLVDLLAVLDTLIFIRIYKTDWFQFSQLQNLKFSWDNCGPATDPIKIVSLSIGPDRIRLPGNVAISTSINITKPFPADIEAKVDMEKKVAGIYIKVPCEHDIGSCSYTICSNSTKIYPEFFKGYNGAKTCPSIPPATYSVSNLITDVKKSIPSIADGAFRITINFNSNHAGHLACLHLSVNLKS
ncbi:unnamed protein product [Adineta steineri]|uniref:MD-2-related lipid-recognition domain-containing protein n=1 Tax=Adineta steineri TaxID=433720 RepID=A0A815RWH7_9BILA|nr:unnamed protein product [Adineta steineri]